MEKSKVEIYTDGACSGNPGPGGWGAVLIYGEHEKQLSGGEPETTNNRMELTAVIEALSLLKRPCEVTLTTDSKYVADSVTKGWVYGWQKRGWKKVQRNMRQARRIRVAKIQEVRRFRIKKLIIY